MALPMDGPILSFILEAASAMWVEVTMFAAAALVYVVFLQQPFSKQGPPSKASEKRCKLSIPTAKTRSAGSLKPADNTQTNSPTSSDSKPYGDNTSSTKRSQQRNAGVSNVAVQRAAVAIKTCAREKDLEGASEIFNRLAALESQPSALLHNSFLDACVQCGNTNMALNHFEQMKEMKLADVVAYNTLLKMHLANGSHAAGRALIQEMTKRGLQANKVTYNEMLLAKVMERDTDGAWVVIEEMKVGGIPISAVTCSILMKLLTKDSRPWDVKRVIALVGQIGDAVDEVLVSSVIEACVRIRQLGVLSDFLTQFRTNMAHVQLCAPTYGSMIKAYGQAGDVEQVQQLWNEMEERNVQPTSITMGCMVEALVTNGRAQKAWELIHRQLQSEEQRGHINTVIYSTVLKGFALMHSIDKVFKVYEEMRNNGIPCNTITYNTLLDACAKCSAMNRAGEFLEHMKLSGVEPDIITYSTLIKGYCLEGDVDRAFTILNEMKNDDKLPPDEIMYNSILDGCAKQHRVDDALQLVDEMKGVGITPSNYTLSILVKLLGHARRLNQAFTMVEDLSNKHGFRPNVQVYTCLMQACILNRRLDRALSLYDVMASEAGCIVDQKLYTVLARGCLQLRNSAKAMAVVRAAFQLPGHELTLPARQPPQPVGVEQHALEDLFGRLRKGTPEDQQMLFELEADLAKRGCTHQMKACHSSHGVRLGRAQAGVNARHQTHGNDHWR